MADKKISELPVASSITVDDISLLVGSDTDYQFSFTTLLDFVDTNLTVGAKITFGTIIPQNTSGSNGDVFLKTDTATFYQKINGTWTYTYAISTGDGADGTVLYGMGIPGSTIGVDNDSYIDTVTGIFYQRTSGIWNQVFSMATGPQGPQGIAGTNGANGTNGSTILSGNVDPSNLTDGVDGDFYINLSTCYFFGPKSSGVWPPGFSFIGAPPFPEIIPITKGSSNPYFFQYQENDYETIFGSNPNIEVEVEVDTAINEMNSFVQGSGYVDGTYNLIPLLGGSGTGALANMVITGGKVVQVILAYGGIEYAINDEVSISNTYLGGLGTGWSGIVSGLGKSWQKSDLKPVKIFDTGNTILQSILVADPDPSDSTKIADNLRLIIRQ